MHARVSLLLAASVVISCATAPAPTPSTSKAPATKPLQWGLVIHGGAGTIPRDKLTPEREAAMRAALEQALRKGHEILANGGSSVDAVTAVIVILEDSPYFNAGKGAVFTHDSKNELDAAIMYGPTLAAGAVAGVKTVKNPILLARAVMEKSPHVMMVADGAETFAATVGIERVDPSYFYTEERWQQLQEKLAKEREQKTSFATPLRDDKFGTVGAVALDRSKNLAAGTSTGGMTNKRYGRVGDSPLIGAGTYANAECAVSATGHGEYFIRYSVAHDICAKHMYLRQSLEQAAHQVVMVDLVKAGGEGGVIAMDRDGHFTMPFNSNGMYRGTIGEDGVPHVMIYK
jgi:beta-aspartyl-peptidase (threonine type)